MNYLILGGTGTVGSEVVRMLLDRGERDVRVLTRSQEHAAHLPQGVKPVIGDLTDPRTFDSIFRDSDAIFLLIANTNTELFEGLATVNEVQNRHYKRIVYLSVHKADEWPIVPHFIGKVAIESAIKQTRIPYTILRPNNFYQNDKWFKDVIVNNGVYPQPLGSKGCSRVDVRDIAEASINALTTNKFDNKTFALVGPDPLTGQQTAQIYSQILGKEVKYGGDDTEAWYQNALQFYPPWLAYEFHVMYQQFVDLGFAATPQEVKETETIVGHVPRRFEDYARELVGAGTKVRR